MTKAQLFGSTAGKSIKSFVEHATAEAGKRYAKILDARLKEEHEKAFRFHNSTGENFRSPPEYSSDVTVAVLSGGILSVRINSIVVTAGGGYHKVFYYLNFGTRGHIQAKTSPLIMERKGHITHPNSLRIDAFRGYTGRLFKIPAGTYVRGIRARKFTQLIAQKIKAEILSGKLMEARDWKVRIIDERPSF